ncbi:hypothetical protein BY458DRAFT_518611 [Sporodiniella umbellata]|nr:hypothetical protein BY458DRAFT_518611 [Sporodiniella umbellata]
MHKPSSLYTSASCCSSDRPSSKPKLYSLTVENVSKLDMVNECDTPLARFCSETDSPITSQSSLLGHRKRQPRPDCVLESPRVVPFPYHNDSYFLPTAEQDYPGTLADTASNASIYTHGSRSTFRKPLSFISSRPRPPVGPFPCTPTKKMVDPFTLRCRRRSTSFSTLHTHIEEHTKLDTKTPRWRLKKHLFRSKPRESLAKSETSSSTLLATDSTQWYKKLWKFFRSSRTKLTTGQTVYKSQPVWYVQFRPNPSPSHLTTVS